MRLSGSGIGPVLVARKRFHAKAQRSEKRKTQREDDGTTGSNCAFHFFAPLRETAFSFTTRTNPVPVDTQPHKLLRLLKSRVFLNQFLLAETWKADCELGRFARAFTAKH